MSGKSIHNLTIDLLVKRLNNSIIPYDNIGHNCEFSVRYKGKNQEGEMDAYATWNKYALVFEVKTNLSTPKNMTKACYQLGKDEKYFMDLGYKRIWKFYVTPDFIKRCK